MACGLFAVLRGGDPGADLDRDALAEVVGRHHDPYRGYGPGAVVILRLIREGTPWPIAAAAAFDGQGSAGNGAAMRAAPLGAWHADSVSRAAAQGARAAEVTHAHPDGIAGGAAVTVAAALAAAARLDGHRPDAAQFLTAVAVATAPGHVRDGLDRAVRLAGRTAAEAAYELGNGARAMARDTVPFALWVAARHLDDYPAAVTACVTAGGDVDTTAAITGGVVAAYTGIGTPGGVPDAWLAAREPLPGWMSEPLA
jgi:ADP-ribosylglycohydrolase